MDIFFYVGLLVAFLYCESGLCVGLFLDRDHLEQVFLRPPVVCRFLNSRRKDCIILRLCLLNWRQ